MLMIENIFFFRRRILKVTEIKSKDPKYYKYV